MPGILKHYAQNLTRSFAVTTLNTVFFSDSDLATWVSANSSNVQQIGSVYIVDSASGKTVVDVILGNGSATELIPTNGLITDRKNLKDLGKEVFIGSNIDSRVLVLRRVQRYVDTSSGNGSSNSNDVGYVVVENNASNLSGNNFRVSVARV
jgi:hypothetical protein